MLWKRKCNESCFSCTFYQIFGLSNLFGLIPFNIKCLKNKTKNNFKINPIWISITIIHIIFLTFLLVFKCFRFHKLLNDPIKSQNKMAIFSNFSLLIENITSLILFFTNFIYCKINAKIYKNIAKLQYELLNSKNVERLLWECKKLLGIVIFFTVLGFLLYTIGFVNVKFKFAWYTIVITFLDIILGFSLLFIGCNYGIIMLTLREVMFQLNENMKKSLKLITSNYRIMVLMRSENNNIHRQKIFQNIKNIHLKYLEIYHCFVEFNNATGFQILILSISIILMVVLFIYCSIHLAIGHFPSYLILILLITVWQYVGIIIFMLFKSQDLYEMVNT